MPYESIVFMQGDDADEALRILYGKAADDESVVWSGPFAETIAATFEHLGQWDYGEPGEMHTESEAGSSDRQVTSDDGQYLMTWNLGLGYIGLERIVSG